MKPLTHFILCACLTTLLAACATTAYDIEKQKAMADDLRRLGDAYTRQGDYTRALRYYLEAADHYADDPQLQYSLGLTYQEKGNYDRAIEHFQRALAMQPDMAPAKNSLGVAYIKAGEYDKAIAILKQMIEERGYEIYVTPQYSKYNLGWAYYQKKQYKDSDYYLQQVLDYYTSGIPKDDVFVKALRAMGLNALAQSRPEQALVHLEKAAAFAPKWADLYLDMARAYRLEGDKPHARKAYQRVIELAPSTDIAGIAAREAAEL